MIEFKTRCPFCGKETAILLPEKDYADWMNGKSVQDAFPYFPADTRESLISGICPSCWNSMFPSESEEEDEDFVDDYDECGYNPYTGAYDFDC